MAERKYTVWDHTLNGKLVSFLVGDQFVVQATGRPADDDKNRPDIAEFPISELYDKHSQLKRARMYAEYMNKINDATREAYEQALMVEVLKR